MRLDKETKQNIIKLFGIHANDDGSEPVKLAIWTFQILKLHKHLLLHPSDQNSREGLKQILKKRQDSLTMICPKSLYHMLS